MLLEQLKELIDFGFVKKETFSGYPLHVEYSLTEGQGREMLKALKIMQHIGIEYLKMQGKLCIQPNRQRSIRQAKERVASTFLDGIIGMRYLTCERYVYQVACVLLRYASLSILPLLVMQVSLCL